MDGGYNYNKVVLFFAAVAWSTMRFLRERIVGRRGDVIGSNGYDDAMINDQT